MEKKSIKGIEPEMHAGDSRKFVESNVYCKSSLRFEDFNCFEDDLIKTLSFQ